jgi:large subunit ribosomal protein L10
MPSQQVLEQKIREVEEVKQLIKQYKAIGVASLQKVRGMQLQELKKKLRNSVYMRVIKNTLMKRAITECKERPGLERLIEHLTGSNIYLFTNLNPFKLSLLLDKSKVKTTAKAGDVAAFDVIVPAGNTGLPPGPIISQLNAVGLPTRIEAGSVWINRDTLVAKKGEIISQRLASVLSKLGIKPVEAGLSMKVVYDDGLIITEEHLSIDLDTLQHDIETAHKDAFVLSINIAYPAAENIQLLLQNAHQKAYNLSLNAAIPTPETIRDLLRKAHVDMLSLSSRVNMINEKKAPPD